MKKVNALLDEQEIKRLLRKTESKPNNIDIQGKINMNYDKERLKKIV